MSLSKAYTKAYGQLPDFFSKIREGQAPERFTQQLLKDLGFTSSNHRAFIPILKELGFLSPDGKPTSRYHEYRDYSKSKKVMAEALKEAYSDIFLINAKPTDADKEMVQGKFKSYHNVSDNVAKYMMNTFYALLGLADLDHLSESKISVAKKQDENKEAEKISVSKTETLPTPAISHPSLHYNIQIHLPATKDIEVYNAIFKSLKEHLFEV